MNPQYSERFIDHDPTDRIAASTGLQTHHAKGEILTGLIYLDPEDEALHRRLGMAAAPLNALSGEAPSPGSEARRQLNQSLRQAEAQEKLRAWGAIAPGDRRCRSRAWTM